ncbi:hypothetical protein NWF32_15510 [Pseudomonas qingdaonensis]|nr:hypothetical protein [Pseudomonas qingdaonensis]
MTIRLVRLLVMGGAALLASCALFNPYVQSIAPETKTATGSQLASKIRMELQGKTNGLAYWQSGSSLALAGALGLGATRPSLQATVTRWQRLRLAVHRSMVFPLRSTNPPESSFITVACKR